jgi:membrane-bound transcription factor site-1 protease
MLCYALHRRVDLINLAVGGPDFRDAPFVGKVRQLADEGIVIASGAGNSGPGWGSLLNPADELVVLGVGGVDATGRLAAWSSRGMTQWESPHGAGRVGVDVVGHGEFWGGSNAPSKHGGCQFQWGTSVACPVVVGSLALLLSGVSAEKRRQLRSAAAIKQVLARGARRLDGPSILEQGSGLLDLGQTAAAMDAFTPHASAVPPALDLTRAGCPYLWPWCDLIGCHMAIS